MNNFFFVLICIALLSGCSKHVKTYYHDGKLESEYTVDHSGKKNGLYKFFDRSGNWYGEMEMIHDTLSGLLKIYTAKSGKLWQVFIFERGLYNIPWQDTDLIYSISHHSSVKSYAYNASGETISFCYSQVIGENKINLLIVRYNKDTISLIRGVPIMGLNKYDWDQEKKESNIEQLQVPDIPKCQRNLYILDSTDRVIESCVGCQNIDINMDAPNYTIRVEYIDSAFHIKHSIEEPFLKWNKRKFPDGNQTTYWSRD